MRAVIEWLEAFALCFIIGLVALLSAASIIHSFDAPQPRKDLTIPPISYLCPDNAGHCKAGL